MAKASVTYAPASEQVVDFVNEILELPEFSAYANVGVAVIVKSKEKEGETVAAGKQLAKTCKVPAQWAAIARDTYHIALVLDEYLWDNADKDDRAASVHRALMKYHPEVTEDGVKAVVVDPEFVEYSQTLRRYGAKNPLVPALRDVLRTIAANSGDALAERMEIGSGSGPDDDGDDDRPPAPRRQKTAKTTSA